MLQLRPPQCSCGESIWEYSWICLPVTTSLSYPALDLQARSLFAPQIPSCWKTEKWASRAGTASTTSQQCSLELGFGWDEFLPSACSFTRWHKKRMSSLWCLYAEVSIFIILSWLKNHMQSQDIVLTSVDFSKATFLLSHCVTGADFWCSGILGSGAANKSFGALLQGRST